MLGELASQARSRVGSAIMRLTHLVVYHVIDSFVYNLSDYIYCAQLSPELEVPHYCLYVSISFHAAKV